MKNHWGLLVPDFYRLDVLISSNRRCQNTLSLSPILPFSGWTWVSRCLLRQRMMEVVATTGLLRLKVVQSSSQIITTNIQFLYRPDALPVAQPTVSKHWREKYHIACTYPKLTWGLPTLSLTTKSSWLPRWNVKTLKSVNSVAMIKKIMLPLEKCTWSNDNSPSNIMESLRSMEQPFS